MKSKIIKIFTILIAISMLIISCPHFFRNTYTVIISDKQIKIHDKKEVYMIYTQIEGGETRVFKNFNSTLEFKFNSEDIYGGLRRNGKYTIKTYGFRIPLFSCYENIIKAKAVK